MTLQEFSSLIQNSEYANLIEKVQSQGRGIVRESGYEIHHIHPRGLEGEVRESSNLIKLTLFEHCLAHLLLFKLYPCSATGQPLRKMLGHQFSSLSEQEQSILDTKYGWSENLKQVAKLPVSLKVRQKIRTARKGKICITDGVREFFISEEDLENYPNYWRGHTAMHVAKGGLQSRGRKYVHKDQEERLIKPEQLFQFLEQGYSLGRSPEHSESLHKSLRGRKSTRIGYRHSVEVRKKMSDSHKGNVPTNFGRVSVIRDGIKRFVSVEELETFLKDGWIRGSKKLSVESRMKLSRNSKGHRWSEESRLRKSLQCRGRESNTKGRRRMYKDGQRCIMVKPENVVSMEQQGWSLTKHSVL